MPGVSSVLALWRLEVVRIVGDGEIEDLARDQPVIQDAQSNDIVLHNLASARLAEGLLAEHDAGEGIDVEAIGVPSPEPEARMGCSQEISCR